MVVISPILMIFSIGNEALCNISLIDISINMFFSESFKVGASEETQARLNEKKGLTLTICGKFIEVISETRGEIVKWPISSARSYGHSDVEFWIEIGRHTKLGEGTFTFLTREVIQKDLNLSFQL